MTTYKMKFRMYSLLLLLVICCQIPLPVRAHQAQREWDQAMTPLSIDTIEPATLDNQAPRQISIYGTDFSEGCIVRLLGYGLLKTSFINQAALTAEVPAGVAPGLYDVEITDGDRTVRLVQALTILAPTPTPQPTPAAVAPPPGRPILTIRNYSIDPQIVGAGEEFTVSLELYNNGSRAGENTMVVFPGTEFIPLGDAGNLLWQLHINHTVVVTQKLRAPANMSSGIHHVQVNASANDWEGKHYDYPHTIPVEIRSKAPITGQPRITIEDVETQPEVLIPGAPFTLTLKLANRGSRTAINVFTRCQSDMTIPQAGSDTVSEPLIAIDDSVTMTVPLFLTAGAQGGRQKLDMLVEYEDYDGTKHTSQENIGVVVDAGLGLRPKLLVNTYTTAPEVITPGAEFTLTVTVQNVGGGQAEHVSIALGGENGAALAPISILHAGNVVYVDSLGNYDQTSVLWHVITDGNAQAKAYNIPLTLSYDDVHGERHSDTQSVSLLIHHIPELDLMFYRDPGPLTVGVPTDVSLELFNIGQGAINIQKLDATGSTMDVQIDGTYFSGIVEAGGSAPLDITVTPENAGRNDLVILTTYRDTYNNKQVITSTLQMEVSDAQGPQAGNEHSNPSPVPAGNGDRQRWELIPRILKGLLGLGS